MHSQDTTFQKLFETSVLPKLSNGHKVSQFFFDMSVLALGWGMWRKVCVDNNIGSSLSLTVSKHYNNSKQQECKPKCECSIVIFIRPYITIYALEQKCFKQKYFFPPPDLIFVKERLLIACGN